MSAAELADEATRLAALAHRQADEALVTIRKGIALCDEILNEGAN